VHSITIWTKGNIDDSIRLTWSPASTAFAQNRTITDVCNSTSIPAFIHSVPLQSEDIAGWITAASAATNVEIARMTLPAGAYIDVSVSARRWTGLDNSTVSTAGHVGLGVAGEIYYFSYDATVGMTVRDLPTIVAT
jgi:hypothetical protein